MKVFLRGKTYWCEFKIDKKRYQLSTKSKIKHEAEGIASSLHADILRGKFNIPISGGYKHIFSQLWTDYIKHSINPKDTVMLKQSAYNKHFKPVFAAADIKNITKLDIKNYQASRRLEIIDLPKNSGKREAEISFGWLNKEINILSNFFNYCITREIIDKNPASGIKKLNTLKRIKTLSFDSVEKLANSATNQLTKNLILFLVYTGCRKGEALNLKWADVDINSGIIAIKATKTKNDRYIPISNPLKELLMNINRNTQTPYVFNYKDVKIKDFKRSFSTACRNANLSDLRIHDLRHVFASFMVKSGTTLYKTGVLLGHKTPGMTQRYAHLIPEELVSDVNNAFKKPNSEML